MSERVEPRSFLGPLFDHDMFVSYAHGPGGRLKHWSHCLVDELKNDILTFGRFNDLDVFLDKDLDPTGPLTAQLRGKVQASGLLLVVMSDHYLESSWCKDELAWFESEIKQCQEGGGLVLVVRAQPTEHDLWPACLKDERGHVVPGFQFHPDHRNGDGIVHPYGWPEPLSTDRPYFEELGKLSTIVTRRLREIKERGELEARVNRPRVQISIKGEPKIYLQAPIAELEVWRCTKHALEKAGCKILPEALPKIGSDLKAMNKARTQRLQILNGDAHALCLLGSSQANGLDREIETIATDRAALQAFGKDLPCALLHRSDGEPALAKALHIDTINAAGDDWLIHFHGWLQKALSMGSGRERATST